MNERSPWLRRAGRKGRVGLAAALVAATLQAVATAPDTAAAEQDRTAPAAPAETTVSMDLRPARGDVPIGGEPILVTGRVSRAGGGTESMSGTVRLLVEEVDATEAPAADVGSDGTYTLPPFELPALPEVADGLELSVAYEGGAGLNPSTSPATIVDVYESDPELTLTSPSRASTFGRPVTFFADVARVEDVDAPETRSEDQQAPRGSVAFAVDGEAAVAIPLDSEGTAEWSVSLPIGRHVVSADYLPVEDDPTTSHAETVHVVSPPAGKVDGGLTVLPAQLSRRPVAYRFSGELVLPSGYPPARGCSGTVTVRMSQGEQAVSGSTRLDRSCSYASRIASARLDPSRAVTVTATFGGNGNVQPSPPGRGFIVFPYRPFFFPKVKPWIVSLGESYVAGEGGRWAGNSNSNPGAVDALGPTAYHDNATNTLTNPPGYPVTGTAEIIKGCHRSHAARVFIRGGVGGLNLACSGALTHSHFAFGPVNPGFKPGIDFFLPWLPGGQAAQLSKFAATHRVRVVVLGIGGNDFGFGQIASACLKAYLTSLNWSGFETSKKFVYTGPYGPNNPLRYLDWKNWHWVTVTGAAFDKRKYCSEDPSIKSLVSPASAASIRAKVKAAIVNAASALAAKGYQRKDYTILFQTVPDPIAGSGEIRYSQGAPFNLTNPSTWWDKPRQLIGGCGFWDKDLDWIHNVTIPVFNSTFKQAAADAAASTVGFPAYHPRVAMLDVEKAFAGRRLCEKGTDLLPAAASSWPGAVDVSEWVTQLRTFSVAGPYQLQEGLHPNYWGHLALRACVRRAFPKALLEPPVSGTCIRGAGGLDTTKTPGEPKMVWM